MIFSASLIVSLLGSLFLARKLKKEQKTTKKYRHEHQSIKEELASMRQEIQTLLSSFKYNNKLQDY